MTANDIASVKFDKCYCWSLLCFCSNSWEPNHRRTDNNNVVRSSADRSRQEMCLLSVAFSFVVSWGQNPQASSLKEKLNELTLISFFSKAIMI